MDTSPASTSVGPHGGRSTERRAVRGGGRARHVQLCVVQAHRAPLLPVRTRRRGRVPAQSRNPPHEGTDTRRDELRPWLHTVIKHEALAVRRQRERSVSVEDETAGADAVPATEREPDEAATGRERVHRTAEALGALKPSEMQCLILKALGYSYDEIAARTGFSWTKVNRSLTEGRRLFFERFGEIAAGTACRRYQPLLSVACDGHAGAEDQRMLKAHLASCSGCRAALREYRSAPTRLAELLPPVIVLPLLDRVSLWSRINDWIAVTAGDRATAIGMKLQHGAEAVSAQKAAAVVASTAAIAGGGAAVQQVDRPDRDRPDRTAQASEPRPIAQAPEPARAALPAAGARAIPAVTRQRRPRREGVTTRPNGGPSSASKEVAGPRRLAPRNQVWR